MIRTFGRALALLTPLTLVGCGGRECYVGVRGTEASITVKALFPDATCDALIKNPVKYIGDIAEENRRELCSMSERPTQPVMCEYTIDGKHFLVRDDGMFKVVGNILCASLARRAD
jgi:hypothetical protein